ncbi:hypothetical protein Tco_0594741 [Tanacetum coccineum]
MCTVISTQSHDSDGPKSHPLEQVRENLTCSVQTRTTACHKSEILCSSSTRKGIDFEEYIAPVALAWKQFNFVDYQHDKSFSNHHPEKDYLLRKALYGLKQVELQEPALYRRDQAGCIDNFAKALPGPDQNPW